MKKTILKTLMMIAAAFAVSACGNPGQAFIGLYSQTGTLTVSSNGRSDTGTHSGNVNFYEGVSSDLVFSDGSCTIPFDVDDAETASIRSGSTCTGTVSGSTLTLTFNTGTATRTSKSVNINTSGSFTYVYDGQTYVGTFTETRNLSKLSK